MSSSPVRRSILAPKPTNITPRGRKFNNRLTPSPTKNPFKSVTPSPKKSTGLGFTIWEDNVDESNTNNQTTTTSSINDQENNSQPKKVDITRYGHRKPLGNLNINEYKGYITMNGSRSQLSELYQSKDIDDEVEMMLKRKQQRLEKTHMIRRHTRSLSVGKNESKLVKRNRLSV
ncbi:hypothetical protein SBY92_003683 [Candida maltosa Xu316]|uniref:Uncharacterized protein n=1 Tax=Candida maltosa (strain Xu316) TaxID=1245528 RepID=M3K4H7_CANMX|nr:hypothetical protein G210_4818 [Candida maltosa Xu316]